LAMPWPIAPMPRIATRSIDRSAIDVSSHSVAVRPNRRALSASTQSFENAGANPMRRLPAGMVLPRRLQIEFSRAVQHATEDTGTEISPAEMWRVFSREYLPEHAPIELVTHETSTAGDRASVVAHLRVRGDDMTVTGEGNGPIAAFVHALRDGLEIELDVVDYSEHAV